MGVILGALRERRATFQWTSVFQRSVEGGSCPWRLMSPVHILPCPHHSWGPHGPLAEVRGIPDFCSDFSMAMSSVFLFSFLYYSGLSRRRMDHISKFQQREEPMSQNWFAPWKTLWWNLAPLIWSPSFVTWFRQNHKYLKQSFLLSFQSPGFK